MKPQKIAEAGDILISVRAPVGPTNIAEVRCCIGRGVASIRCPDNLDRDFLAAYLKLSEPNIAELGSGSTFVAITGKQLRNFPIPLPPLAEQKRIVAVLNQQMAAVERAKKAAQERLEAAQALRESFLGQLLANHETVHWSTVRLLDLCEAKGQYGTSRKSNNGGEGTPVLGMGNIQAGRIVWENLKHSSLDPTELNKYRLRHGDLLFNRTNSAELVGKTAVYRENKEVAFASYLIRFQLHPKRADPRFVSTYINSPFGRSFIQQRLTRAVGQANISASVMHEMLIPTPPLEKQIGICDLLDSVDKDVSRIMSTITQNLYYLDQITPALLRRAFSGEI